MSARPDDGRFRRDLSQLDFTFLVTGAIVGDGIFVLASMGATSLGPAQLMAWLAAGVLSAFIALAFVQCAAIDSEVGGSYSYARLAFGPFAGFLAGWTLYAGEWLALSAFPRAFFNYFQALTGVPGSSGLAVRFLLIGAITGINLGGVRLGARANDGLTVAKLLPLALLALLGVAFLAARFGTASDNVTPFAPLGWGDFGKAVLPIFWAYAGFELAVLPASEVRNPHRALPRGLMLGVAVATLFYLLVSLAVVVAAPWQDVAGSAHPLATVMGALVGEFGGPEGAGSRLMSLGGLISITGVYLVFTLGLARLSYALAKDGFLPSPFARLHPRFGTPYVGVAFQAVSAIVCSTLLDLRAILSTAVLFLSLCYLLTALSAIRLVRRQPQQALHLPGLRLGLVAAVAASVVLTAQASPLQLGVAAAVVAAGIALYVLRGSHGLLAAKTS
jgi:amino acid transporter